jgi:hypothetical protein
MFISSCLENNLGKYFVAVWQLIWANVSSDVWQADWVKMFISSCLENNLGIFLEVWQLIWENISSLLSGRWFGQIFLLLCLACDLVTQFSR